jgi:hypothetical protein
VLCAELQVGLAAGRRLGSLSLGPGCCQRTRRGVKEFSAMHAASLPDYGKPGKAGGTAPPAPPLKMQGLLWWRRRFRLRLEFRHFLRRQQRE